MIQPQRLGVVLNDLATTPPLHDLLRATEAERVQRACPQDFIIDEHQLFMHM